MNKPLKEHYEDCNGQIAVFNYIEDLEKYIDYLVKLNLPVVSRSKPRKEKTGLDWVNDLDICPSHEQSIVDIDKSLDLEQSTEDKTLS